jgi:hypothetical protein
VAPSCVTHIAVALPPEPLAPAAGQAFVAAAPVQRYANPTTAVAAVGRIATLVVGVVLEQVMPAEALPTLVSFCIETDVGTFHVSLLVMLKVLD